MDPLCSETCRSTFKYFIILIVSTNGKFVHLLDIKKCLIVGRFFQQYRSVAIACGGNFAFVQLQTRYCAKFHDPGPCIEVTTLCLSIATEFGNETRRSLEAMWPHDH